MAGTQREGLPANQVEISLGTDADNLAQLFSHSEATANGLKLTDIIGHAFNQTLLRDNFYGSWADVWTPDPEKGVNDYGVKLTSPTDDISAYTRLIHDFLAAGRVGLRIWNDLPTPPPHGLDFLIGFGLAMANAKAIQLLHSPPSSALQYRDYLYSPTNRRVESLLLLSGMPGAEVQLAETIVDLVPIAADGGSAGAEKVDKYNESFVEYDKAMLAARIRPGVPVIGYGSPVRTWVKDNFNMPEPGINELVHLPLFPGQDPVPVLFANHPDVYLYDVDESDPVRADEVLTQDLITYGYQATTAQDWSLDKAKVLADQTAYWKSPKGQARMKEIAALQREEFGFGH